MKFLIIVVIIFILNGCSCKYNFKFNKYNYYKNKIDYKTKYSIIYEGK